MISIDRDLEWLPMMKKINDKLDKLEEKIELIKSNTELIVKEPGKKKVK